ncbi:hypothetical protein BCR35DRAFT_352882 [Leucosporidium creatinivorum]|uniref:BHLH domain-containing protein n=1 Tax=Leucosporidium creatinivorum TaxID=106004 RepID=A0A1Y2F3V9_9BASI|nr:hypothetical protein BCR35DRAFT_352882 [Leucosporidium creatinivorum]
MTTKSHEQWTPPTPQSVLVAVSAPCKLPPDSFEPLPPSSLPRQEVSPATDSGNEERLHKYQRPRSESLAYLLNPEDDKHGAEERGIARATPSSINNAFGEAELTAPVLGYFNELQEAFRPAAPAQEPDAESPSMPSLPSIEDDEDEDPSYTTASPRKRPKREAAVTASRNIPRQPSPFELSPPPRGSSGGGAAAGASGSQSNRKVSHSLIERRRRERINDCLAHLRQLVPQCREEGEKKVARAKERGRKRGRKGDDDGGDEGQRGGLHKLEILQGTIRYVEELETRIATLEGRLLQPAPTRSPIDSATASPASLPSDSAPTDRAPQAPAPVAHHPLPSSYPAVPHQKLTSLAPPHAGVGRAFDPSEEATAELLLNLSTSPELRPISFD